MRIGKINGLFGRTATEKSVWAVARRIASGLDAVTRYDRAVRNPTTEELQALLGRITKRVMKLLTR